MNKHDSKPIRITLCPTCRSLVDLADAVLQSQESSEHGHGKAKGGDRKLRVLSHASVGRRSHFVQVAPPGTGTHGRFVLAHQVDEQGHVSGIQALANH